MLESGKKNAHMRVNRYNCNRNFTGLYLYVQSLVFDGGRSRLFDPALQMEEISPETICCGFISAIACVIWSVGCGSERQYQ